MCKVLVPLLPPAGLQCGHSGAGANVHLIYWSFHSCVETTAYFSKVVYTFVDNSCGERMIIFYSRYLILCKPIDKR